MRGKFLLLILVLTSAPVFGLAQVQDEQVRENIYVVVKDIQGGKLEGYLRFPPETLTVSTKDKKEKSIPLKYIEFIKLEKITVGIPGEEESYYSVKLQNSQEIYALRNKFTLSLNTSFGLVTQTIDPGKVGSLSRKDSSSQHKSQGDKPFIWDTNVVFSLEFKF